MKNPLNVIYKLRFLLNEGGILIIMVPNHKSFLSQIYRLKWDWVSPPDHLHYFNFKSLSTILLKNGFALKIHWTKDYYFRSVYQFYSLTIIRNLIVSFFNKFLKTHYKLLGFKYKYPKSLPTIFNLLPYWFFYPIIKIFERKDLMDELIVISR